MARWEPDSQGRLVAAALELYAEHGYENTTVAEIAERAGLTERTFFRHFADKREVLFFGAKVLQETMVTACASAPDSASPIEAAEAALLAAATMFEDRREFSRQRQNIIGASKELQERELIKLATLASALGDTLRQRGVPDQTASLTAEIAVAVFRVTFERWIDDGNSAQFSDIVATSLGEVKALTSSM